MVKTIKSLAAFLCAALLLSGCGGREKASAFVYRTLDERLQGDMSQAEGKTDTERVYHDHQATVIFFTDAFLLGDMAADDTEREAFDKISEKILAASRYKVTEAKKKGAFWEVGVEIFPNRIFVLSKDRLLSLSKEIADGQEEAHRTERYLSGAKDILMEGAEAPQYGKKKTVWIKVEEKDGKKFIPDEEWTLFLSKLFVLP